MCIRDSGNGTATNCESRREAETKIQEGYCPERSSEVQSGACLPYAELLIDAHVIRLRNSDCFSFLFGPLNYGKPLETNICHVSYLVM